MKNHQALFCAALLLSPLVCSGASLQLLWNVDPGTTPLPASPGDDAQRGMAFNPVTGNVLMVNRSGGVAINRFDGATGGVLPAMDVTGVAAAGGSLTFALSQIAVAGDGTIYAASLTSPAAGIAPILKIYRWANESSTPTVAYDSSVSANLPIATRWGDNIDIRGTGNGIQVLMGQGGSGIGNRLALFTTNDGGASLNLNLLNLDTGTMTAGDTRGGVAFGAGDTVYFKTAGGTALRIAQMDGANSQFDVTGSAALPAGLSGFSPLGTDATSTYLGAVQINTAVNPHAAGAAQQLYLFDISGANATAPLLQDNEPFVGAAGDPNFATGLRNLNGAGAVDFGTVNGSFTVFALDTNNGLRAWTVIPEPGSVAFTGLAALLVLKRRRRA